MSASSKMTANSDLSTANCFAYSLLQLVLRFFLCLVVRWYRLWFLTWSLDCLIPSMIRLHVLARMSSFSINVSVSIQVLQPYRNIEMHAALNKRILNLSLTFGVLNIELSLANAAHASPIRTNITFCRSNVGSEVFEVFDNVDWLTLMASGSVGDKLDD